MRLQREERGRQENQDMSQVGETTDAIQFLLQQHGEARQLLAEIESTQGDPRRKAFERLVRLLAVHETAEEEVVYPVLRLTGEDGARVANARIAEEDEAKKALSDLESTDIASPEFDQRFVAFKQQVLRHAANEEREVFPHLRVTQSTDELERLGTALRAAERVAPTHPHPNAPESAIGNVVLGPFVAIVDRVRDALRDRGD
jgi:hemerythrin superfamily protein